MAVHSYHVTIREHARLTTDEVESSLDLARVTRTAFDWLCELSAGFSRNGASLLHVEGRRMLKWDAYVGVLETPCGTRLEIIPKHHDEDDCLVDSRHLLRRLIGHALQLKPRKASTASLELFDAPLSEWVIQQFLGELDLLVKRGVRFDYHRMEEEQRFLRGQLNVVAQMRQPPGRQHHFQIRHDIFTADRAENRLLKLALEHVCQATHDPASWRLSHELRHLLAEVSASRQIEQDWRAWRSDRLMAHYQPIKPWCELILNKQMPFATAGEWRGISMLFPMERLFERYVEAHLRRQLLPGVRLTAQAARQSLCEHMGAPMFRLEPDLLIEQNDRRWILDTKWKRLDGSDCAGKYKLSQADLYQLYAYGQKYLQGKGELVLIYPRHAGFGEPLQPFDFDADLRLWVLPFDLDAGRLCGASLANLPLGCLTEPAIDLSNVAYSATNAAQKATANTRSDVTRLCTLF